MTQQCAFCRQRLDVVGVRYKIAIKVQKMSKKQKPERLVVVNKRQQPVKDLDVLGWRQDDALMFPVAMP